MSSQPLSVAVPWSLSHYIPLNGFHPLYRALFERKPENISLNAWDNIELSQTLRGNSKLRSEVTNSIPAQRKMLQRKIGSALVTKYINAYFHPNIALTSLLPGDIEFHHTAPFPSLTRPFVLHCESFAPLFFPFSHQGTGDIFSPELLREHFRRILGDPLCLGIFSHIPETLRDISHFFDSREIDEKLYQSRIGLSSQSLPKEVPKKRWSLTSPRFLFVNSANQNPANFFHRGGHVVLRFWQELMALGHHGKLNLRCSRPSDELLAEHGVDLAFLHSEECGSISWIQDYLTSHELNALMADVHFFLLPSASLHSVSIMQAMALGTVPVVSDTIGTSLYVKDNRNGIVLEGVLSANWKKDPVTGVLVDNYHRNRMLEDSLVVQLTRRITSLLEAPSLFDALRQNALNCASNEFSGDSFSDDFWSTVQTLYEKHICRTPYLKPAPSTAFADLEYCKTEKADWPRIFESVPQPVKRIYTGIGRVCELGGAYIHTVDNPRMELHDWSVLAEHCKIDAPRLIYAKSIKELGGRFMAHAGGVLVESRFRIFIDWVSRLLIPFPSLYRWASRLLKITRKLALVFRKPIKSDIQPDIQLVMEGVSGMNVIRYYDKYYAIPQNEGAFLLTKLNEGGYSKSFAGNSFKDIKRKISSNDIHSASAEKNQDNASVELIEEEVHGFNILRFAGCFYAIPQSEGAFNYDRVLAGGYGCIYTQQSIVDIKSDIMRHGIR